MRKLKRERGAITIITIISILFMVSFLISSYLIISNKVKTQKNIIAQMRSIYDQTESMENMYNSFFGKNIVPIYTVEQLFEMGTGKRININGKYYDFSNKEDTIYTLMDDLSFNVADYAELNGYWLPIGERTEQNTDGFEANFEGNTYSIKVSGYIDDDGDKYEVEYSKANEFKEPIYNVKVTPVFEDGTIASDAMVLVGDETTANKGERIIQIKRLSDAVIVRAYLNDEYEGETKEITTKNPNKIKDINLALNNRYATLTITTVPEAAKVLINGNESEKTVRVLKGSTVNYKVYCDGYKDKEGSIQVNQDEQITVTLDLANYEFFTKQFYITQCSNSSYSGLINGGQVTVGGYHLSGKEYDLGEFTFNPEEIANEIPMNADINKITIHFTCNSDRDNTTLYQNDLKTTAFAGTVEKLGEQKIAYITKSEKNISYDLNTINRAELANGLKVRFKSYIKGTATFYGTIKNVYCVIEGGYLSL